MNSISLGTCTFKSLFYARNFFKILMNTLKKLITERLSVEN